MIRPRRFGEKIVEGLCSRMLRRRARLRGIVSPEAVFGLRWSGNMTRERLHRLLENLPPGFWEIYLHPATRDVFPGHTPGYRYVEELGALLDPTNAEALRRLGRRLCGYRDAVALRHETAFH